MNLESVALVEKGKRSLAAAQALLEAGYAEFAASRAYYAMFYMAEAALATKGLKFSRHSAVISAFGRQFVRTGILPQDLHSAIIVAFDRRTIGDYRVTPAISEDEAAEVLGLAERFIATVEAYLSPLEGG